MYRDGEKTGFWSYWHENGQEKARGIYQAGVRTGRWREWWPNGQIAAEGEASGDGEDFHQYQVTRWDDEGRKTYDGPSAGRAAYLAVYQDPFVLHLRKALDEFVRGGEEGVDPFATTEGTLGGEPSGLKAFDPAYYKSKFVVWSLNDSIGGGKNVSIVFKYRPDRMFNAWVYRLGGEELSLRAFWQSKVLDPARFRSAPFLQDDQPAL